MPFRFRTAVLVGCWHDHRAAAEADAIRLGQAVFHPKHGLIWLVSGEIEGGMPITAGQTDQEGRSLMARWNRAKAERPVWPKLVAIQGTLENMQGLCAELQAVDADAEIVEGGRYGLFARCSNAGSLEIARNHAERLKDHK